MVELRRHLWGSPLCLLVVLLGFGKIVEGSEAACAGNFEALAALHSTQNFSVQHIEGIGYGFYFVNPQLPPLIGGPNVTRGLVILPEDGISPVAYTPYAREVTLSGYYVVIVSVATPGRVLGAMMQKPELEYWSLAGHGSGGELAAKIAVTLQPRVKSLVLIGAVLPQEVDLRSINLFLTVIYGDNDTVTTPADVTKSFSRVKGDTSVVKLPGFGHYDFAYSLCSGNAKIPSDRNSSVLNAESSETISIALLYSGALAQWFPGTERALSFGDNHYLTPGFNDSKPYPGDIRVRFEELPIPDTFPQRVWWVFIPSQIKGGIVYYPGAAVEGRAYFPLSFEIAARGHLLVIPEQPAREALASFLDANTIIDSNLTIFSGVPKGRWAISGHSLGGNGAALYTAYFGNKIYATVLHAGLPQANLTTSEVPLLLMYGTLDFVGHEGNNSLRRRAEGRVNPSKTTFLAVNGSNHCQIGDYGYQYPDQIATVALETQHATFAQHTVDFLDALETKSYDPVVPVVERFQTIHVSHSNFFYVLDS